MFVIAVANTKGGCGKTTVATHLAAHYARLGFKTALVDLDRYGASFDWCSRRPEGLPPIRARRADLGELELPEGVPYVVLDLPAGPRRKGLEAVIKVADALVVPVQPSAFDQDGTRHFLEMAAEFKPVRRGRRPVAIVANRVRPRASGHQAFQRFLAPLAHPVVTSLADSQYYVTAAETGVTLFDQPAGRVRARLVEWLPLFAFLDRAITDGA